MLCRTTKTTPSTPFTYEQGSNQPPSIKQGEKEIHSTALRFRNSDFCVSARSVARPKEQSTRPAGLFPHTSSHVLRFLPLGLTTTLLLANNLSSRPLTLKNPDSMSQDRQTVISRDDKRRIITKAIKPFTNLDYRGVDMAKKWPRQRILNEAAALKLIRDSTTIPVPAVIAVGEGPDGFFVTTGLIAGIPLADIGDKCELPALPGHEKTKCAACQATATANAKTFVEKTVLPQLRRLTSYTTGLNGFVNPPPWVTEVDRREFWDTKTSAVPEFVFCHGDLGPYNIMIDQFTLKVTGLIDFENAGYFPSEFLEQRAIDVKGYYKMYKTMYENPAELSRLIKALES